MGVDWGFAGQVGGVGFGMVFALLVILTVVIWVTGLVVNKISVGKGEADINDLGTGEVLSVTRGDSLIVPPVVSQYRIEGNATFYRASVPL